MALPIMAAIGGVTQIAGSLIGGRKRRREQRRAQAEYQQAMSTLQNQQFINPYSQLENVFEDATINQQAAQFQAQQTDAALAQALGAASTVGGAAGGAQAIAQAALQSKQGISADIARQEQANRAAALSQEAALQSASAQAEDVIQMREYQRSQQMLNLAAGRLQAANAARQKAQQQLVGGIGSLAGGAILGGKKGAGMPGGDDRSFLGNAVKGFGL